MRILHLSESTNRDTAGFRVRYQTALKMAERGHTVVFVYPSTSSWRVLSEKHSAHFTCISTPGLGPLSLRRGGFGVLDGLTKTVFAISQRYDVIHVSCGHRPSQFVPAVVGKYLRDSVIVDEWWEWYGRGGHADCAKSTCRRIISGYDIAFEIRTKKYFDGVIPIASALKERLPACSRTRVLHGATEMDRLTRYDRSAARKELTIDDGTFIIGLIGTGAAEQTDNAPFLEAYGRLVREYRDLRLFVTGDRSYIEKAILAAPYGDRVIYAGWCDYPTYNKYLSACDLFVLPLRDCPRNRGRWPHKIGDYMCLDKPFVTNPVGDLHSFLLQHNVGLSCAPQPDAFYQTISDILAGRIDLASSHRESLQVATDTLSIDKRVDLMLEFYQELLGRTEKVN